ncbi:Uncharacterized protein Fot_14497 [Forsythia ovata]|uniref:Uncharacterized protein n=1 Tax=Forsythia ovata TaxID=205694 RepID=A0ABD1W6H7_9LAMI
MAWHTNALLCHFSCMLRLQHRQSISTNSWPFSWKTGWTVKVVVGEKFLSQNCSEKPNKISKFDTDGLRAIGNPAEYFLQCSAQALMEQTSLNKEKEQVEPQQVSMVGKYNFRLRK